MTTTRTPEAPTLPPYLREVFYLLQPLLDLEAAPVARHAVHHGHHRLLDHLPADEALQHLGDLQAVFGVSSSQLLHLRGQEGKVRSAKVSAQTSSGSFCANDRHDGVLNKQESLPLAG